MGVDDQWGELTRNEIIQLFVLFVGETIETRKHCMKIERILKRK